MVTKFGELGTTLVVCGLLVTGNVVPSSHLLDTLMMEALRSTETSVITRATRRNIRKDAILRSYSSFQSYKLKRVWELMIRYIKLHVLRSKIVARG
jgi:hypothetical protein